MNMMVIMVMMMINEYDGDDGYENISTARATCLQQINIQTTDGKNHGRHRQSTRIN